MTTINKKTKIDKSRILRNLDLLLKIQHQELCVVFSIQSPRKAKNSV